MADLTPAQQEFNDLVSKNARDDLDRYHPEDRDEERRERDSLDISEEDAHRSAQIDAAMRVTPLDRDLKLPPASFDAGRTTGVKGVIADARNYEEARKASFMTRAKATVRKSILGLSDLAPQTRQESDEEANSSDSQDEEAFLARWRESRKRELESEASKTVRNRRTSPSVRVYGRLDEVDALGYLDAIEKVNRDTVVVVLVADPEVNRPPWTTRDLLFADSEPAERRFLRNRVGHDAPCQALQHGTLCQGALPRHRIRQRCRALRSGLQEPG